MIKRVTNGSPQQKMCVCVCVCAHARMRVCEKGRYSNTKTYRVDVKLHIFSTAALDPK